MVKKHDQLFCPVIQSAAAYSLNKIQQMQDEFNCELIIWNFGILNHNPKVSAFQLHVK